MNLRVVKLGGSLFDLPDLGRRLERWLSQQPPKPTVLIAGGGMFTDAVRRFDAIHDLPTSDSHQLALRSMSLSAKALWSVIPASTFVGGFKDVHLALKEIESAALDNAYVGVWDVIEYWRRQVEPKLSDASFDWSLTSDSIAALLAREWQADSICMLKSCDRPGATPWEWTVRECVDAQFGEIAQGLDVTWVNLRAPKFDRRA